MADQLVLHKSYLLTNAKALDKKGDLNNALYMIINEVVPEKGGGKVKEGMKANISKPAMIDIMVNAWGLIWLLIKRGSSLSLTFSRDMETTVKSCRQLRMTVLQH